MEENDLNEIRHYSVDPMKDSEPSTIIDEKELDKEEDVLPPLEQTKKDEVKE